MTNRRSSLQLEVGQFSHPGRQRANNEDWLGKFQPVDAERLERKGSLFIVADGMGGHQSGELASRFAVDQVIRIWADDLARDTASSLGRAIELANAALYAEAERKSGQMTKGGWGTTLVAAVVQGDELWIANVGDSRAYLLRRERLRQLSKDHALFPDGGADHALAGGGLGRHIITRAMGRKPAVEVDVFPPLKLRDGDRVLLCSDGLTAPVADGEIARFAALHPPQKAAEALVQAANEHGGPDNVSVILFEVSGERSSPGGNALQEFWLTLADSLFWHKILGSIEHSLPGGQQGTQTYLFIALIVLVLLVLVGLGFILGMVLL